MRSDSYVVILKGENRYPISPETLKLVLTSSRSIIDSIEVEVLAGEEWDDLNDQEQLLQEEEVMF